MREMITIAICLLALLIALQSGMLRTGLDYDAVKKNNENLLSTNERLANEIVNFNRLAGRLFDGNSANAASAWPVLGEDLAKVEASLGKRFEAEVKSSQVHITRLLNGLKITFTSRLLFKNDTILDVGQARRFLLPMAKDIQHLMDAEIRVEGHCANQPLSKSQKRQFGSVDDLAFSRAKAVAFFMEKEAGLDPVQLYVSGLGSRHPLQPNDHEIHRIQNNRIEILIRPGDVASLKRSREIAAGENRQAPLVEAGVEPAAPTPAKARPRPTEISVPLKVEAAEEAELSGDEAELFDAGYEKPTE